MPGPIDIPPSLHTRYRVAAVTGSRADYGLLRPVMRAIAEHPQLELMVIPAGSHLVAPAETFHDVKRDFAIAQIVPMQIAGRHGRSEDVESLARGVGRFGRAFDQLRPDWVLVLGDRIEAFAAASAGSIGGRAVAHVHGGDRAEGVADEAMRHAITKLAHLHLAASPASAERLVRLGERPEHVLCTGSPALDELDATPPLDDAAYRELGEPNLVLVMHPTGRPVEVEEAVTSQVLLAVSGMRVLALHPNFDPGREGVLRALEAGAGGAMPDYTIRTHLPRGQFVGLLKRLARTGGVMVGNSSAALIEAAALRLPAVDIGPRQAGRERFANVVHAEREQRESIVLALETALSIDRGKITHTLGDGSAGRRIAGALARVNPLDPDLLRKRCAY
jgi:UDP-hydrolysing UDP-N-acetyl-D-glucosamine 2-epimerase